MSTVPAYVAPSRAQLAERMRVAAPKMTLYNASDEWFVLEHSGNFYYLPPDIGGATTQHPVTGETVKGDGRTQIGTHYGKIRDLSRPPVNGELVVKSFGPLEGEEANAIVLFAEETFGNRGIVWLDGTSDEGRIAAAKKLWRQFRRAWAEGVLAARNEFIQNWLKVPSNQGKTAAMAPPMTSLQRRAQEFLDEAAEDRRQDSAYICKHDGYDTNDFQKFQRHMFGNHGERIEAPKPEREATEADNEANRRIATEAAKQAKPIR